MSKFVIVAETGADIPQKYVEKYGIKIVPMHVQFGGESLDDGTFPSEKIFNHYKETGELPKTSGCVPGDFVPVFEEIRNNDPDAKIVYLAYSAVTTCSYQSAKSVATGYGNITLIDTKHVCAGQTAVVVAVCGFIEQNPDATSDQVIEFANQTIEKTRMSFIPGGLEFLHAGGRLSNAAFLGASLLRIKPTIEVLDGKLTATKKRRGTMEKCVLSLLEEFLTKEEMNLDHVFPIRSAGLDEGLQAKVEERLDNAGFKDITWINTGGVISSHCGPGSFGIAAITK